MNEGIIAAIAGTGVTALVAGVKWAVGAAVRQTVNGQIKDVKDEVGKVVSWTEDHAATHRALLAALERQGINRPDGL